MTSVRITPELLAIYGFIDAEEYLRLTDTQPRRAYSAADRELIANAQRKRWQKSKEKRNAS